MASETSDTSFNGTGALCFAATVPVTRSVPALKDPTTWHLLESVPRDVLRQALSCGDAGRECGAVWAFQQASGLVWRYIDSNPVMSDMGRRTLDRAASLPRSQNAATSSTRSCSCVTLCSSHTGSLACRAVNRPAAGGDGIRTPEPEPP